MSERIKEIDYLKCLFIVLMVAFHLVYIGDKFPYAKQVVYTFHMPGFLLISGYLLNVQRDAGSFLRKFLWIFIPYAVMEAGYVVMASILPVRESVGGELSLPLLLRKVFLHPMGPYWYLHTLILCSVSFYAIHRFAGRKPMLLLLLSAAFLFAAARWGGVLSFINGCYFLLGAMLRVCAISFTAFFRRSLWAVLPLVVLCCFPANLDRAMPGGMAIVWLVISFLLATCRFLPAGVMKTAGFIGKNTLVVLLFSPIFTMLSKGFLPLFASDRTGMLFLLVAVCFTLGGSFAVAWCMDKTRLSRWLFGRERVLN